MNSRAGMDSSLFVNGTKNLKIDHPLDPAHKYLLHASIDSPEPLLVYSGNTTTGADRRAVVLLPAYVEVINQDFRYQLTVVGQFAQAMVASEIDDNRFTIETDKPHVKVSWQVTGVRHDAYLRAAPYQPEQDKLGGEDGVTTAELAQQRQERMQQRQESVEQRIAAHQQRRQSRQGRDDPAEG